MTRAVRPVILGAGIGILSAQVIDATLRHHTDEPIIMRFGGAL